MPSTVFPNEKATEKLIHSDKYYNRLSLYGFARKNIYIFNYFKPSELKETEFDCVYISGGNTFQTLDRIRKSGADKIIVDYVKRGAVYIGGSAGAHIASANIEHLLTIDPNSGNITDYTALGLFNGILFCHYTDKLKLLYEETAEHSEYKVYTLTDDESIVCLV